ncbi:ABC transporter ATP-binding protein [Nanoarchaeota archaeon]|nr:MAG: ABC transporter ATP-binding protein [Nanoarchaeota archaeon]
MIETRGLTKFYDGTRGIEDLNITVKEDEIFGLLGPNGAGKTTTLKLLSCLLKPTRGTALINGFDVRKDEIEVKKMVGYMPEENEFYEEMRVEDYLQFFGELYGVKDLKTRVRELMQRLGLYERRRSSISTLSKGMKRKLLFAKTLIHNPQVLLLDELTGGIDPITSKMLMEWVKELRKGRVIIYSTHNLHQAELICDRVAIINKGKLVAYGPVNELKLRFGVPDLESVFFKAVGKTY